MQLYYQIGLAGKQEINLAPDLRSGFEMILLRMLAFRPESPADRPAGGERPAGTAAARPQKKAESSAAPPPKAPPAASRQESDNSAKPLSADADWGQLVEGIRLGGISRQLADNCTLERFADNHLVLLLSEQHQALKTELSERRLQEALQQKHGSSLTLEIRVGQQQAETPAQQMARAENERLEDARRQMAEDPLVQAAQKHFDARVLEDSVKPVTRGD